MAEENSSIIPEQVQVRLAEELQEEVLVRLPVRSLIRFKSVCKEWRSMFESRPFMDLYGQRHPRGVCNSSSSKLPTISSLADLKKMVPGLHNQTLKTVIEVAGGVYGRIYYVFGPMNNGIYCLTSHLLLPNRSYSILSGRIALCNPATHEYKFADPFPPEFRPMLSAISNSKLGCRLYFGFGNVQINNNSSDYRFVVLIQYGREPYTFLVFVYSVQRRKWKKIVDYVPGRRKVGKRKATDTFDLQGRRIMLISYPLERCPQRFFKGCCFWTIAHPDASFSVLLFNFADQSFKLLSGPPYHMDYVTDEIVYKGGEALVLHDHLAFIRDFKVFLSTTAMRNVEIGVWMMMEYGVEESWTRIYTINPDFNGHLNRLDGIDYEVEKECGGGISIKSLFLQVRRYDDSEEIISCDAAGHEVLRTRDPKADVVFCWNTPGISTYVETLERL